MIFSVTYFVCYFGVLLWLLWRWSRKRPDVQPAGFEPRVSVLLAFRNEENTLLRCLQAIERLDYPKDKLEVLIGDDRSTDRTAALVEQFIAGKPHFRLVRISGQAGNARAKANVLVHLIREATTDFFLITDADMEVPPTWARYMLAPLQHERVGVVSGVTAITGEGIFEKVQALDWVYSLGLIQVVTDLHKPITALGNNMLLRRQAYEATGGFEKIPHSITEDVQIFKYITRLGWRFANLYQPEVLGLSLPAPDVGVVLQQRKRWMTGSMHLPWYMVAVFVLHASFYVVLLTSFYYLSAWAMLGLSAGKLLLETLFLRISLKRLRLERLLGALPAYEVYLLLLTVVLIPFYYLPIKINWKGREYKK